MDNFIIKFVAKFVVTFVLKFVVKLHVNFMVNFVVLFVVKSIVKSIRYFDINAFWHDGFVTSEYAHFSPKPNRAKLTYVQEFNYKFCMFKFDPSGCDLASSRMWNLPCPESWQVIGSR